MVKNIENLEGNCTGCGACKVICPSNAIRYEIDKSGFYAAVVNDNECIKCKKCVKICIKEQKNIVGNKLNDGKLYAGYTKDKEVLAKCTSGGISYEILKNGIKNNFYIVGVVYNYDTDIAETIVTKKVEDLERIKGSKYIQSKSDEALMEIIKICKEDSSAKFIITGTPCQIAGYRTVIESKKIDNEIYYIDLFCHGVPSYLVWNEYINSFKKKYKIKKLEEIDFRSKKDGWHNFVLKLKTHKKSYYKKAERELFYNAFFDNILLNKACFRCKTRGAISSADIRLGDFWGNKYKNNYTGVSAILILTENGNTLIDSIEQLELSIEDKKEECFKYQSLEDYKDTNINIEKEFKDEKLKNVIKKYRKKMSKKYIITQRVKYIISFMPLKLKKYIKRVKR